MKKNDIAGDLQTKALQFSHPNCKNKVVIEKLLELKREIPNWIKELKKETD